MTRDEMLAFCHRRVESWKRRDPAALASDHTEHGTVVSPIHSKISGRDVIQRSYESLFQSFPDWSMNNAAPLSTVIGWRSPSWRRRPTRAASWGSTAQAADARFTASC